MSKSRRPFTLPPLDLPTIVRIGMFGFFQPKKTGKTSAAAIIAAISAQLGFNLQLFQNDEHDRLKAFGEPILLKLATATQMLNGKNTQDLINNEPLLQAIESLADHPKKLIIHDSSAPAADRIGAIYRAGDFNNRLVDLGCTALLCVPFRDVEDVALGALAMMGDLDIAMPDHFVIPIAICDREALHEIGPERSFWKVVDAAKHGVISITAIAENYAQMIERIDLPITSIADRKDRSTIATISDTLGCGQMVAGGVSTNAAVLLSDFYKELFVPLGFTPGA